MHAYYPAGRLLSGDTEITMLDIGQGDCLFVDDGHGRYYLIDAGSSSVERVGEQRIEPFLLSRGIKRLDAVFVSHGDADHMNAVEEMMCRAGPSLSIDRLVTTDAPYRDEALDDLRRKAASAGVRPEVICAGQSIANGDSLLTCLGPSADDCGGERPEPGNEASMVLRLSRGDFSMLFTGDAEGTGEEALTRIMEEEGNITILKVAHHGSKYSSSDAFLQTAGPRAAWISAGQNNLYGHPHGQTIERLNKMNCRILRTDKNGCISLLTDGKKIRVSTAFR